MNPRWLRRQTQILLSWREHLQGLPGGAETLPEVDQRLAALRADAERYIGRQSRTLAKLENARAEVMRLLHEGRVAPGRANQRHRALTARIDSLEADLQMCQVLIAARGSAEAGGFIEERPGRYRALARRPAYLHWATMDSVDRATLIAAAVCIVLVAIAIPAYRFSGRGVVFSSSVDPVQREIKLRCTNNTAYPVRIALENLPAHEASRAAVYVVWVAVRDPRGEHEQMLSRPGGGVHWPPSRVNQESYIELPPGLGDDIGIRIPALTRDYPEAFEAVVSCTNARGGTVYSALHSLAH